MNDATDSIDFNHAIDAPEALEGAKRNILEVIKGSEVPEDFPHANNTLQWLLRLNPTADQALQIAALAHDIDRASTQRKVHRADYPDYDVFKAAHAENGATILGEILNAHDVEPAIVRESCRLVRIHEVGGCPRSDLLKDADSLSYFEVNLHHYFQREGLAETRRRTLWGYRRLSPEARPLARRIVTQSVELEPWPALRGELLEGMQP